MRNTHRNRAVEISAPPLKEIVLLHIEHDVEIAGWTAIGTGFPFSRHTQSRPAVHARWNPQIDRLFAFQSSLTAAFSAAFFDGLPRALARRTRPGNREKSLLVGQLSAPAAGRARTRTGSCFRSSTVARPAQFLLWKLDLGGNPRRGLFERQRHVIAQVRSALLP